MNKDILQEEVKRLITAIKKELPIKKKLENIILQKEKRLVQLIGAGEELGELESDLSSLKRVYSTLLYNTLLKDLNSTLRAIDTKNKVSKVGVQQEFIFEIRDELEKDLNKLF